MFENRTILAVGAHFDDVELKCAGTFMKHKADVHLVVCTDSSARGSFSVRSREQNEVNKLMGYKSVLMLDHKDGELVCDNKFIQELTDVIGEIKPDYIFTHYIDDFNQNHRAVAHAVRAANRLAMASLITFPSQDFHLPFAANMFVDIDMPAKERVLSLYRSQRERPWFRVEPRELFNITYLNL